MIPRLYVHLVFLIICSLPLRSLAQQQPIVADLSRHLVAIDAGFSGSDVLLFGATDGPGDIVIVVKGPPHKQIIRRKSQVGPVWMNTQSVTFRHVPSFYHVASSAPLHEITTPHIRDLHQMGTDFVNFSVEDATEDDTFPFRQALIHQKTKRGLYSPKPGKVEHLANRLFRSRLYFPSNVSTGIYVVEVYLLRNKQIISAEITPLSVNKVGFGAEAFYVAKRTPFLYGVSAVCIAIMAGWVAAFVFRKG